MMFKKQDGKVGFSFNRLILNAVPNFANDNAKVDAELSLQQQDDLFAYQMGLETPKAFNDLSLLASRVVEVKQHSKSVLAALHKVGIVNKTDGSIHTDLITRKLPHQVSELSVHRQRKLVSLLFFWEEELTRWRLLDEEEVEIRTAMEMQGGDHEALKVALGTVWVRRSTPPSKRDREGGIVATQGRPSGMGSRQVNEDGNNTGPTNAADGVAQRDDEMPPGYYETKRTVSISGGKHHQCEERMMVSQEGESSAGPIVDHKEPLREGDE